MAKQPATPQPAARPARKPPTPRVSPPIPEDDLGLAELAAAVLARSFRPRVRHVRRLAEAVLAAEDKRATKKKAGKTSGKKRKLAKIPGQKRKK